MRAWAVEGAPGDPGHLCDFGCGHPFERLGHFWDLPILRVLFNIIIIYSLRGLLRVVMVVLLLVAI